MPYPDCDLCFTNNRDLNWHILDLHFGSQMSSFDKIKSIYAEKITDINENFQEKILTAKININNIFQNNINELN